MLPRQFTVPVLTNDDNGVCQSQTPAAGGVQSLTLNGALVSGGVATTTNTTAQIVTATWAGNDTNRVLTLTFIDADGISQTGTISGASGTTSKGTFFAQSISAVSIDANSAGAIEVGFVAANGMVTSTFPMNWRQVPFNAGLVFNLTAGTMIVSVQYSVDFLDPPLYGKTAYTNSYSTDADWRDVAGLSGVGADTAARLGFPVQAVRLIQTTGSTTGAATYTVMQGHNG